MAETPNSSALTDKELFAVLIGLQDDVAELKQRGELPNLARAIVVAQELSQSINTYEASAAGVGLKAAVALQEIKDAGAAIMQSAEEAEARITNAKKAVTSLVQLMQGIRSESQADQESARALLTELVAQQKALAEAQTKAVETYAELIAKLDADAINDAAAKAAKGLVTGDIKKVIDAEVKRQVRLALKQGG